MTDEPILLDPEERYCRVPASMVDEITLCAGFRFVLIDEDQVALELLTEADVERLTAPEASA